MEVNVFDSRKEMGEAAAKVVASKILELLSKKESIRMVFAAAPSQNEFLESLVNIKDIPWNRITAFHMDEYLGLPKDHPALFANFLKRKIFDQVPFREIHFIDGNNDPESEGLRYAALIEASPIDIVCMGIGENGHIAFNDPPVALFNDPAIVKKVTLDTACRQQQVNDGCFPNLQKVPKHALTLTVPALLNADFISCVVPGKNKKEALQKALYGFIGTQCPASILRIHGDCHLFTDKDAYKEQIFLEKETIGKDLLSGYYTLFNSENKLIETRVKPTPNESDSHLFFAPGLVDLQVNGVNGVDFNNENLSVEEILKAAQYLLSKGVTVFFPTLITNEKNNILRILKTFRQAVYQHPLIASCVAGIHLEGPFISPKDGARGAHNLKYIQSPNWELIEEFQDASGGLIKLITLAPELEGAMDLIKKCQESGIKVAIGHSLALSGEITKAAEAGASLSTHLGNAVPLMLPRHPNILWDQLAHDGLYASLIADGFHLGESFLKVVLKTKGEKAFLVSDSTMFCGMEAGEYGTHIGEQVILEPNGKLALKHGNGLLAGASKCLLEGVQYLIDKKLKSLSDAWKMASTIPAAYMDLDQKNDVVIFSLEEGCQIYVQKIFKDGKVVFQQNLK
ncbi:glucosamine-6-phosphate deaminase [Aquiflexum balticum DSM 16537]|uniref:Glucosamine-6-phosphate deaminase n=1 Tax=Aquiflexum balticum DSM 16537 TaxID=758820 RepID=A0A1W2H3T6_9BACT|nr:6-phosphogluconolactonase [Aquiflexum balticum]SMD43549.1 glucosamine-6-phosphate deaminase [Aquiflexum balticum DSM 16537]